LFIPDPIPTHARGLRDVGLLALCALAFVPIYLVLNQYWQSIVRLLALYGLLMLFCLRLGGYIRRAMRRLPAEIPPWDGTPTMTSASPWLEQRFGAAEAIRHVRQDPEYVQNVLKPRLRRLLAYRLSGSANLPFEALDDAQLAQIEPALMEFLQRRELTGMWARWRDRRQRVDAVLTALRHIEGL
jgi:hypothetical protein